MTHAALYILGMSTGVMLALGFTTLAFASVLVASALLFLIGQEESQR